MKKAKGTIARTASSFKIDAKNYYIDATNIRHFAGKGVHYQADQIIYGAYEKNDEKEEDKQEESVELRIGMFFDGTCNNRFNTRYKYNKGGLANLPENFMKDEDSSYANDYTNIVKLKDLYQEKKIEDKETKITKGSISIYVEGIGTATTEEDANKNNYLPDGFFGYAFGIHDTGVYAKVQKGYEYIIKGIQKDYGGKKITKITFDVFGFSRGAAAARHFCNEVSNPNDAHEEADNYTPINSVGIPYWRRYAAKLCVLAYLCQRCKVYKDVYAIVFNLSPPTGADMQRRQSVQGCLCWY